MSPTSQARGIRSPTDRLHVQSIREGTFREKLQVGDDFAGWCVRFGVPLLTSKGWLAIVNSPDAELWPDWRKKVTHAARRLMLAATMVDAGDDEAAAEETLYAASHAARAMLLKSGVFPLSRPEMVQQLQEAGHRSLAELLKQLIYGTTNERQLRRAQLYMKKLLVHLDKITYGDYVNMRREVLLSKRRRAGRLREVTPL